MIYLLIPLALLLGGFIVYCVKENKLINIEDVKLAKGDRVYIPEKECNATVEMYVPESHSVVVFIDGDTSPTELHGNDVEEL